VAIQNKDSDTVTRLAKTKRILNGRVDYTPPPAPANDDGSRPRDPQVMGKWTALHECVRDGNPEMMKILVDNRANLEIKDVDDETPAFVASTSQNSDCIKVLLDAGANADAVAGDGWSCLMMATRNGNYEVTKALLEAGADLRGGSDMFGRTALDISTQQAGGQGGVRMSEGETFKQGVKKLGASNLSYLSTLLLAATARINWSRVVLYS
jgi:hypothetical protein